LLSKLIPGFISFLRDRKEPLPGTKEEVEALLQQFRDGEGQSLDKHINTSRVLYGVCRFANLAKVKDGNAILWNTCRLADYIGQLQGAEVSPQDVVDALLALVDEHGSKLPGGNLARLYAKDDRFRAIVDEAGGPKNFCMSYRELEFVTTFGGQGHVQRRAAEVTSQDVVDALLALVDEHGGKLPGSHLPLLYAKNDRFRAVVDGAGGPKKFCTKHRELEFVTTFGGPGYIQRRAAEASSQDVADALLAMVDEHGGKLPGGKLALLYSKNDRFRAIVDEAGGPKNFCRNHRELEFVIDLDGQGHVQRCAAEVNSQDVADALLALVDEYGGKLPGSHLPLLYAKNDRFRAVVDGAGGPKKFCMQHRELEFVTTFGGPGHVQRRASEVTSQDVVDALLALVDEHGGKLPSNRVRPLLDEKSKLFKSIVDAAGSVKKFCVQHNELDWFAGSGGQGWVQRAGIHNRPQVPIDQLFWSQDCIKIRFRNGKLLAETLQDLLDDPLLVDRLPLLEVVEREKRLHAVSGNRRLWVLKELGRLQQERHGRQLAVRVRLRCDRWAAMGWVQRRFTTKTEGRSVTFCLRYHLHSKQRFWSMALALAAEIRQTGPKPVSDRAGHDDEEGESDCSTCETGGESDSS